MCNIICYKTHTQKLCVKISKSEQMKILYSYNIHVYYFLYYTYTLYLHTYFVSNIFKILIFIFKNKHFLSQEHFTFLAHKNEECDIVI